MHGLVRVCAKLALPAMMLLELYFVSAVHDDMIVWERKR